MKRLYAVLILICLMFTVFSGCEEKGAVSKSEDTTGSQVLTNDTIVAALNEWQSDKFASIRSIPSVSEGNVTTYFYSYADGICQCTVKETDGIVSYVSVNVMTSDVSKTFPELSAEEAEVMSLVLAALPISLMHYPDDETTMLPTLLLENGSPYNGLYVSTVENDNWKYSLVKGGVITVSATDTDLES